ncbi:acyltransferase family protein [Blastococcus haudaquaticus]|uniref:Peptidoglycan/LPS O-acetylase OafA/YrhL, contains acyltransferase and SGNH-hydrolase domains n=1 Tax=Blastococcus haudaquaticus TaxID=1938745 RepID=A0A286GE09_9ACTN|nr:acyltransferase [Blastococcus haudaquaticus]SOD93765.1 Peptidoglycan/LPS O-acetylase OafA/YrhL, contains acyltransferase and SGNH-hydrolase domains [Blastococcus haudaquaticus]
MTTTPVQNVAPETHAGDQVHAARARNGRLEFLDALRGIAALVVAVQHLGEVIWPELVVFSHVWWRPGEFGVLVFFICSGFIIPASMERRGNLSEFWIGRVFRLFPLYLSVLLLALIAFATPWAAPGGDYRIVSDSLINATMLQVFFERPLVIGASWTLGYEMVFYLLMTVLFMLGWHRRSAGIAMGLVTAALVLGGFLVPFYLIQPQIRQWPAVVIGLIALAVAIIAPRLAGRQRVVALSITLLILMLFLNRPNDLWFSLLLLASMFTGTVLYRYDIGELPKRTAAAVFCFAVVGITLVMYCYQVGAPDPETGATPRWWTEAGTFVSAYLVFGALFLLRRFAYPRVLVYLGTISYSVYLVHALVLLLPNPPLPDVPAFAVLLGATLVLSVLTYHFIEKPGQLVGRRMIALYRERQGGRAAAVPPAKPSGEPPAEERARTAAAPGPEVTDQPADNTASTAR